MSVGYHVLTWNFPALVMYLTPLNGLYFCGSNRIDYELANSPSKGGGILQNQTSFSHKLLLKLQATFSVVNNRISASGLKNDLNIHALHRLDCREVPPWEATAQENETLKFCYNNRNTMR